jgi:hypothetical protein|nr:hypothetical protein [Brucella anthropi]
MPLFNEASRIYKPEEVNFMRSCFSNTASFLKKATGNMLRLTFRLQSLCFTRTG